MSEEMIVDAIVSDEEIPTKRQQRKVVRKALREIKRTGRNGRNEIRRIAAADQLPPTRLGRAAYHARSTKEVVEEVAGTIHGIALIATGIITIRAALREWRNEPSATNSGNKEETQEDEYTS